MSMPDSHPHRLAAALREQSLHEFLVTFARREAQTAARLRAAAAGAAEADALAAAYADALARLPALLAERPGDPLSPGTVWAIGDTLDRLRHVAQTSTGADDWRGVVLPTPSTLKLRDAILAAEAAQTVREQPFVSHAPLVGPLLVRLREAWNWMSTTWYVRPLLAQQNTFNAQAVAVLRQALEEVEAARWERDLLRLDLDQVRLDRAERERAVEARQAETEAAVLQGVHQANALLRRLAQVEGVAPRQGAPAVHVDSPRPRLAFFSPLSPLTTGVAAYSEALLPALAEGADVEVYVGDFTPTDPAVARLPVLSYRDYPARRWRYDATVYQMGNNPDHAFIYDTLREYPGVVVVHDLFIHHFVGEMTLRRGRPDQYVWEMGYAGGLDAMRLARDVVRGARPAPAYEVPLIEGILDHSLGALCHSQYVRDKLAALRPSLPVAAVSHPTQVYARRDPAHAPDRPLTVITAAFLTPEKGLLAALEGFARFRQTHPSARYVLQGAVADWFDLPALVAQFGLQDAVEVRGYAPTLQDFDQALAGADIALSLRYPSGGETSGSLLRALGVGLPAVVTDIGWFSEVPDTVCLKTPAPPTPEAVAAALATLADDAARREEMGQAAAAWVAQVHSPEATARGYLDFITALRPTLP